jgi:hypothetical protein
LIRVRDRGCRTHEYRLIQSGDFSSTVITMGYRLAN